MNDPTPTRTVYRVWLSFANQDGEAMIHEDSSPNAARVELMAAIGKPRFLVNDNDVETAALCVSGRIEKVEVPYGSE